MNTWNRFKAPLALAAALSLPVLTNGCGEDNPIAGAAGDLCCTDFKVGADLSNVDFKVDASIKGQFAVLAQAGSDFSGTATAMIDDVTNACRDIATDLGATEVDRTTADANTDPGARVKAWCALAVAQLKAAGVVQGRLQIQPPQFKCEASIAAKANCQAKCDVSGQCDIKANPPKCSGGKPPTLSCEGGCKAEANASFQCKGACDVTVSGKCTASGGVECQGKCEGTCEAKAGAQGSAVDAQGNCQGVCKGTCQATAPNVKCEGTFEGECKGTCSASGGASVECNASCTGTPGTPIKCEGGSVEGGCKVDAKCDANCDASVSAKANCQVEPMTITVQGTADAKIEAAIATLQVNLPKLVLAVKARGQAVAKIAANFTGAGTASVIADPGKLGVKGSACALAIVSALVTGADNVKNSLEAGVSVTGQIGLQ